MKYSLKKKARIFKVGINNHIEIKDVGEIYLDPDEQITFVTSGGKRHDFVSKTWGFYVTPSINVRLKKEGFKTALVKNKQNRIYLKTVEKEKIDLFNKYCKDEKQTIIEWLDESYNES